MHQLPWRSLLLYGCGRCYRTSLGFNGIVRVVFAFQILKENWIQTVAWVLRTQIKWHHSGPQWGHITVVLWLHLTWRTTTWSKHGECQGVRLPSYYWRGCSESLSESFSPRRLARSDRERPEAAAWIKWFPQIPLNPVRRDSRESKSQNSKTGPYFFSWVRTWVFQLCRGQEWNSKWRGREVGQINERTEMVFQKMSVGCLPNSQH